MNHPNDRAERLALLEKNRIEKRTKHSGKVRRQLTEPLKDLETQDELQRYKGVTSKDLEGEPSR